MDCVVHFFILFDLTHVFLCNKINWDCVQKGQQCRSRSGAANTSTRVTLSTLKQLEEGKNTPVTGVYFLTLTAGETHQLWDLHSCEWQEVYTHNRVYGECIFFLSVYFDETSEIYKDDYIDLWI